MIEQELAQLIIKRTEKDRTIRRKGEKNKVTSFKISYFTAKFYFLSRVKEYEQAATHCNEEKLEILMRTGHIPELISIKY